MRLRLFTIALTIITGLSLATLAAPRPALALFDLQASKNAACQGVSLGSSSTCDTTSGSQIDNILSLALELVSVVVGIIAVVMVIIGGLKYITSQGDSASVASAKNTLLYAIIGLVIVAFAQLIVQFVLHRTAPPPTPTVPPKVKHF